LLIETYINKNENFTLLTFDFYNGEVLLINKPYRWSSFQAVNKIKHAVKHHASLLVNGQKVKPRVGHAGTLDPLATGLLIVCTGKKTKTIHEFMGQEKEYTGTFFIGATTPCFDLEKPVDHIYQTEHITDDAIYAAAKKLTGVLMQSPPLFSAVLIDGTRAYELARKGEDIEVPAREIEVKLFEITANRMPEIDFRIVCSKGTYIRSIARDFGMLLGSGAHLMALCRTRIGSHRLQDASSPDDIAAIIRSDI
jgi:tRNA pseudouridine55 synthase